MQRFWFCRVVMLVKGGSVTNRATTSGFRKKGYAPGERDERGVLGPAPLGSIQLASWPMRDQWSMTNEWGVLLTVVSLRLSLCVSAWGLRLTWHRQDQDQEGGEGEEGGHQVHTPLHRPCLSNSGKSWSYMSRRKKTNYVNNLISLKYLDPFYN